MKRLFAATLLILIAQPLAESGDPKATEDARLERLFKERLDIELKHKPYEASKLGDHRFDDLLEDLSPKARAANTARARKTLDELPKLIDYKKLSRSGQIDFEIWQHELKKELWLADNTDRFSSDPRVYNDYIVDSVYVLQDSHHGKQLVELCGGGLVADVQPGERVQGCGAEQCADTIGQPEVGAVGLRRA